MGLQAGPKFHCVVMSSGPLVTKTITTYSPRVNAPIPAVKFDPLIPSQIETGRARRT